MVQLGDTVGADWEEMARTYKQLTVGTSAKPITVMLEKSNALLPFSQATGIHDNGCGPGPVIGRIISDYGSVIPSTTPLSASDFAPAMVKQVKAAKAEALEQDASSPWNRVDISVKNAMDLQGISDASLSHVLAGWVYFMTPDPMKCLAESHRVLAPDGVLACSSWKTSQWMEIMRLVSKIRPDVPLPEVPQAWADATLLQRELERAGFRDVEAVEVDVEMHFDTAQATVELLATKMPHIVQMTKDWSEEERERLKSVMLQGVKEAAGGVEPGKMMGTALVAVGRK